MKIGVIGYGVVGGAVGQSFLDKGIEVVVYDKFKKIGGIEEVAKDTDVIFVCVPTPTNDGMQDLSPLNDVLAGLHCLHYKGAVVVKCTVLPGTCDRLQEVYDQVKLVHNPEFLTERNAVEDFKNQRAAILSSPHDEALAKAVQAFAISFPGLPILTFKDFKETELGKYIHNCFLAVKVAVMNEFYNYAEHIGTSYSKAIEVAKSQGVIGHSHTAVPGPDGKFGFGGMCFPKDTEALVWQSSKTPDILAIIHSTILSNRRQRSKK